MSSRTTDLWIVCHGFGQLAREFLPLFEAIAIPGRALVAPEALSRFYMSQGNVHTPATPVGATWMTTEDRENEIVDYVAYLDLLLAGIIPRVSPDATVTALGFSQGVATVSRWVAQSGPSLKKLVLWGGLLPPEFKDPRTIGGLVSQPLHFVSGTRDRYITPNLAASQFERLKALGISVSFTEFDGGHVIDSAALRSIAGPG